MHNSPSIQVLSVNPREYSSVSGNPKAISKLFWFVLTKFGSIKLK